MRLFRLQRHLAYAAGWQLYLATKPRLRWQSPKLKSAIRTGDRLGGSVKRHVHIALMSGFASASEHGGHRDFNDTILFEWSRALENGVFNVIPCLHGLCFH